jgi:hypothetical protein
MPKNGDMNKKFGFYQNLCCGREIVVLEGNQFPDCPSHPRLTFWKPIIEHDVVKPPRTSGAARPHFNVGDEVRIVGPARQTGSCGSVADVCEGRLDHIYRYQVRLENGSEIKCFGFELELIGQRSVRVA